MQYRYRSGPESRPDLTNNLPKSTADTMTHKIFLSICSLLIIFAAFTGVCAAADNIVIPYDNYSLSYSVSGSNATVVGIQDMTDLRLNVVIPSSSRRKSMTTTAKPTMSSTLTPLPSAHAIV